MDNGKTQPEEIRLQYKSLATVLKTGEGEGRHEIRIVSWNGRAPVLEKRQQVGTFEDGEDRWGKNKGFTLREVKFIVENGASIIREMEAGKRACRG